MVKRSVAVWLCAVAIETPLSMTPTRIKISVFALAFLSMPLAWADDAQDFQRAEQAYEASYYEIAFPIYERLAEQGNAGAQYNLGQLYRKGQGVRQDNKEAIKWYRKATDQGHARAQYNLGVTYANGQGAPQDYVQAHMWFNLAASSGAKMAAKNRDIVAEKMTPEQIAEAQRLAQEWMEKHKK